MPVVEDSLLVWATGSGMPKSRSGEKFTNDLGGLGPVYKGHET